MKSLQNSPAFPPRQAAPAGVQGGHPRARTVAQKDRQTIGGHDHTGNPRATGVGTVCRQTIDCFRLQFHDVRTMHLVQVNGTGAYLPGQGIAVLFHQFRVVAHMASQVQTVEGR
jgi:hypothetical protein